MSSLVHDFLGYARICTEKIDPVRVDLARTVDNVLRSVAPAVEEASPPYNNPESRLSPSARRLASPW